MIIQRNSFAEGFIEGWQSVLGKDERPSLIPKRPLVVDERSDFDKGYKLGRSLARPG
jgi:hypothetical protein